MSWVCPYCNHAAVIRDEDRESSFVDLATRAGNKRYRTTAIACPNPQCNKPVVYVSVSTLGSFGESGSTGSIAVLPKATDINTTKDYPDYIPAQIIQDYREACAIVDLSPKSSATLARRALQGMIRDFWNVKEENLSKAIKAIEDKVSSDIWGAIDGVRKVGNIGAHMEKDINLIIDVNPEEATLLISMIEMLLEDWYVARFEKHQRIEKMKLLAVEKTQAKKNR